MQEIPRQGDGKLTPLLDHSVLFNSQLIVSQGSGVERIMAPLFQNPACGRAWAGSAQCHPRLAQGAQATGGSRLGAGARRVSIFRDSALLDFWARKVYWLPPRGDG